MPARGHGQCAGAATARGLPPASCPTSSGTPMGVSSSPPTPREARTRPEVPVAEPGRSSLRLVAVGSSVPGTVRRRRRLPPRRPE
jgi:hypothetical protein